jgi:hypothetical protein
MVRSRTCGLCTWKKELRTNGKIYSNALSPATPSPLGLYGNAAVRQMLRPWQGNQCRKSLRNNLEPMVVLSADMLEWQRVSA